MTYTYLDSLNHLGVGGAHPGGLQLTKKLLLREKLDHTKVILDAGCGTGQTSAFLKQQYDCKVVAIDRSKIMIEKANKRFSSLNINIEAIQGNIEQLPFEDRTFDVVLSESVMAFTHIPSSITQFKNVLKPTGKLIAIEMVTEVPLSDNEMKEITDFYQFTQLLSDKEWLKKFEDGGFNTVKMERFNLLKEHHKAEDAPDFMLTETMDNLFLVMLEEHQYLTEYYKDKLGYRVFTCC